MTDIEEESKRISLQVASISTQLIESIEKQSRLEDQLQSTKRENETLKAQVQELPPLKIKLHDLVQQHQQILKHNIGLGKKLELEVKQRKDAKEEVSKLQKEVEELSVSLFDEANKMVSDARRETHETKLRNESLISQLKEKDLLLDNLQSQLKELKNTILDRDSEPISRKQSNEELQNSYSPQQIAGQQVLYSPTVNSIRFDLKLFSEFKSFLKSLDSIESIRATETKFLKKLLSDDVEPALRFDLASGISWLSKRPLMSAIIDGRVAIEPVSGINETYRLNFQNNKSEESDVKSKLYSYPPHSPPVAVEQPCALCGESRNDILEHSRLYIMKVHAKKDDTGISSSTTAAVIASQYPLCSYCLFRVRSSCDLFAFLRSLKTDAWKLENEVIIKKAWVELSRLRSKLFWSKVGIWDIDVNIVTTRITPGLDDSISKAVQSNPSRLSYMSSVESFDEINSPVGSNSPGPTPVEYKSSPLSNEIGEESSKDTTVKPESSKLAQENDVKEQEQDGEEEGYDADLFDSYSQEDKDEEEEEEANNTITENVSSLKIDTKGNYSTLDPEAQTPILPDSENVPTPIQASTPVQDAFNFEDKDDKTKESGERQEDTKNSDDDDNFVDA